MGCDIHAKIEIQEGDWWDTPVGDLDIRRNYALFGYLAGVRDSFIIPISPPRGLPEGANYWLLYEEYKGGHSASWVTHHEFCSTKTNFDLDDVRGKLWFQIWSFVAKKVGPKNCRLVFFFDS